MCKNKLTISDVAKLAGVSKTTISHYLNGKYEYMSKATREHIAEIIKESGYQPSKIAQSLKRQNSYIIGVIVSDIESPFSSGLIKSIEASLVGTDYLLMTANTDNNDAKEVQAIEAMLAQQVDGLIIHTTKMSNTFLMNMDSEQDVPIVLVDRFINNHKFDIVFIDNKTPINNLIDHLVEEEYEDIYFFTEHIADISSRFFRTKYFKDKMLEVSFEEDDKVRFIDINELDEIKAYIVDIMETYVKTKKRPAVICENGVVLFVVAKCMKELGLSLPEEIALCGYDDWGRFTELGWADMLLDGITTVSPSVHKLGKTATELLLEKIKDPKAESKEIIIEAPMHIRNSTELQSFLLKQKYNKK